MPGIASSKMDPSCDDQFESPITKKGFDIHVYFNSNSRNEAVRLRSDLINKFPDLPVFELIDQPIGPHSLPMFEAQTHSPGDFARCIPWLCLNHGNLSILVHPNTTDIIGDHTNNAIWIGDKIEVNVAFLDEYLSH
eukprot:944950_1